jgi:hypothetical protein
MHGTLTFLHTTPAHIPTFDRLLGELDGDVPVRHIVHESLLREARAQGITPRLEERVGTSVRHAFDQGATVVACTCSTIAGSVEAIGKQLSRPIVRIDRPMAERAVELGSRIVVAATLRSSLDSTRGLLLEVAERLGKPIELTELVAASAWPKFERGDLDGYAHEIAAALTPLDGTADVIVLAQASMADAAELSVLETPVLSSPRSGIQAALAAFREA